MSRFRAWPLAALVASGLLLAACGGGAPSSSSSDPSIPPADRSPAGTAGVPPAVTVPAGAPPKQLETADLITGTGPAAKAGDTVTVQYVLATYSARGIVQSSWSGQPFTFTLDANPEQVIPGWDRGVAGMKVGGRRELIIPPSLGYGNLSPTAGIAKDDTLVFVVDLLKIN